MDGGSRLLNGRGEKRSGRAGGKHPVQESPDAVEERVWRIGTQGPGVGDEGGGCEGWRNRRGRFAATEYAFGRGKREEGGDGSENIAAVIQGCRRHSRNRSADLAGCGNAA